MSWLSQAWKHNQGFVSNALKNVAPLSFLIPGVGPLAAAGIAGAGSALGQSISRHPSLKGAVGQGLGAAAMAYGGAQGLGALKGASGGIPTMTGAPAIQNTTGVTSMIPGSMAGASSAGIAPGASSAGSGVLGALGKIGTAAKNNLPAIGQVASGVLSARETGQQTALEREKFEYEKKLQADQQARQAQMAQLLAPLFHSLVQGQQPGGNSYTPYNPYGAR